MPSPVPRSVIRPPTPHFFMKIVNTEEILSHDANRMRAHAGISGYRRKFNQEELQTEQL